jgi:hypothetical protein
MGQAADQIGAKQLSPKHILPLLDEVSREIRRRGSGEFVWIGVHCR